MSLPQQRQSPTTDLPQEDDPSRSNITRYDSIQGALGGRRVSQPAPLAYIRSHSDITPTQAHMPPEHRYSFPSSSNQQYSYEYPPSSYATPVYSHNSLPRMRTPHSLSESSRTPVPPSYGLPPYLSYPPSSQYAVPSGMPAPSWAGAPYSHYSQSPTDASVSPELVRVEPVAHVSQQDTGPYRTSDTCASTHVDTAPHISGSSRDLPTEAKGKQREGLPPIHRSRSSQEPDYHKLSETYRLLLDNANHSPTLASPLHALPSGLPSSDVISRLYEFALEGVRQFDASEQGEPPPRSPSPQLRSQPSKDDLGKAKRQRTDPSSAADSQKCMGCGATSTPEWRRGPLGPRTLCNACGLVYAKLIKKRGRVEAGRFIEGAASFTAASAAESVPSEFHQDFGSGVPSGSTGAQQPPYSQQDEDDRDAPPHGTSSAEGEGSEDDSYEDFPSHSQQEGRR